METGQKYYADSQIEVTKAKDLPYGVVEAIIATDDLDRHGEHVSIKGMKIEKDRNYKVYYNHQTTGDSLPIGKYEKIWKKGNQLMGRFKMFVDEYPFAEQVYKLIKAGGLDSMSVGFLPKEFDADTMTWTMSDFMEGSVVAEPANVMAVITSKSLDFTPEDFEKAQKDFSAEPEPTELQKAIKSIEAMEDEEELKALHEAFIAKAAAVGITLKEFAQNPTEDNKRRVRLHLRSIKGETDTVTNVVKRIKLKET